jgi:hypothetical protein
MSMTSIGQEGKAVWNLYIAPITPRQLFKVKLIVPVLFGLAFSLAMLVVLGFVLKISFANFLAMLALSVPVVLAESAVGLYFAARYADFRDVIRTRFVSVWGSLFGTFVGLLLVGIIISPILMSVVAQNSVASEYVVFSVMLGLLVFVVSWRLAEIQMGKLLREIQA